MNEIDFNKYGHFWEQWQLVTTRYRHDTNELRFTYANEIAWNALRRGNSDYPDGSVFGKVGLGTEEDADFRSSLVPTGSRRYQLMVRDKTKYNDTDGWGYALFDATGTSLAHREGSERNTTAACHACHKLVADKGYIFSEPMQLDPGQIAPAPGHSAALIGFDTMETIQLPEAMRKRIPDEYHSVRVLRGDIGRFVFSGTLDEIRPTLVAEAIRTGTPSALIGSKDQFSVVFVLRDETCTTGTGARSVKLRALSSEPLFVPGARLAADTLDFCHSR